MTISIDTARAHQEQRHREQRRTFPKWLNYVTPDYDWDAPHLRFIQTSLDLVTAGTVDRLMLFLPPRHGKSEMTTVRYPVWRLEREPDLSVIVGAYNKTLADTFSRRARRIAVGRIPIDAERNAAGEWLTEYGGSFRAAGVGSGVTGKGGNLIIIDDPIKSREEANSEAYRERVWNWYRDDIYTRREPDVAIILIMTRWHEDDLAGRILESEDADSWHVVMLPALAEDNDPLGRPIGAALWPSRFDVPELKRTASVLGEYSFTALYQQRPTALEGGLFKRNWFEIVPASPARAKRVRYWDTASTEGGGDFSAGCKMALGEDGTFYIEDVARGQWSYLQRRQMIHQCAALDGYDTAIYVEQEPGGSGKEAALEMIRSLAGFTARRDRVTGDKFTRAQPLAAQCEAQNVKLIRGDWNRAFIDELAMFPNGKNDDQVDAASGAFAKLSRPTLRSPKSTQG